MLLITIALTALGGEERGAIFGRAEAGEDVDERARTGRFTREPAHDAVRGSP